MLRISFFFYYLIMMRLQSFFNMAHCEALHRYFIHSNIFPFPQVVSTLTTTFRHIYFPFHSEMSNISRDGPLQTMYNVSLSVVPSCKMRELPHPSSERNQDIVRLVTCPFAHPTSADIH
ncbi:hypothetical protein CPB84DRAFT_263356 [Gymnopilus junonius]|uniref:Secreted protein n=1 Tax=Gymnopilus junonius TaxID=109634 RepID=A0A9P5NER4_GYMJU|nr:hypothetical protein CPB84DRAFT_263356 [Gymnopilus junonius]